MTSDGPPPSQKPSAALSPAPHAMAPKPILINLTKTLPQSGGKSASIHKVRFLVRGDLASMGMPDDDTLGAWPIHTEKLPRKMRRLSPNRKNIKHTAGWP